MKQKFIAATIFIFIFLGAFFLLKNISVPPLQESMTGKTAVDWISGGEDKKATGEDNLLDQSGKEDILVIRVVDGDTIEIEGGKKIRYIGIDTPEVADPRKPVQCFGRDASAKNKELVEGKRVRLEKDVSETDKYGRLLRYVYVGNTFVNETLVKEGYAFSSPYPPDVKYQELFNQAEKEARAANSGLWGSCGTVAGTKTTVPATDCVIKGNISSSGEKIYHLPGQKYYNQTVINESAGELWFCSEQEAVSAGWRKSKI